MCMASSHGIAIAEKVVKINFCIAMFERVEFRTLAVGKGRGEVRFPRHDPDQR